MVRPTSRPLIWSQRERTSDRRDALMTRILIRVGSSVSDDVIETFPHLTRATQRATTTLVGDLADAKELQGVLDLLSSLGVDVIEIVTIPE